MARKENGVYIVRENIFVDRYMFDGTAEDLKRNIDAIVEKAEAAGMVNEGVFDFDLERGSGYYSDDYEIKVTYNFDREENDKEKTAREKLEAKTKEEAAKKRKKAAEARKLKKDVEYAEFLRLKEKFEG